MANYNWWDAPTNTGYYKGIYFALVGNDIEVKAGEPLDSWYDAVRIFIRQQR